jgi:hypothetical protein
MLKVVWNPLRFPNYRGYESLSIGIWSLRWLFLYLRSYNLVGSVTSTTYGLPRRQDASRRGSRPLGCPRWSTWWWAGRDSHRHSSSTPKNLDATAPDAVVCTGRLQWCLTPYACLSRLPASWQGRPWGHMTGQQCDQRCPRPTPPGADPSWRSRGRSRVRVRAQWTMTDVASKRSMKAQLQRGREH